MSAINFPNAPQVNDEYAVGDVTYIWDGVTWTGKITQLDAAEIKALVGDAAPTGPGQNDGLMTHEDKAKLDNDVAPIKAIQAVPPDNPVQGQEWFDSVNGISFTYYGTQWVSDAQVSTALPAIATQQEAETGIGANTRLWSPVRIWQAIVAKLASGVSVLLSSYTETGSTLTFVAEASGDIEIPLDGKVYQLTITGDCSLTHATLPSSPEVGSTVVYILIDTSTPPEIATDAAWNWPDSTVTDIPTADEARAELILNSTPQGWVIARVTEIGVPA